MGVRKRRLWAGIFTVLILLGAGMYISAQQPQCPTCPLYAANAKYTNGVAPGYWSKPHENPSTSLIIDISSGTVFCLGTIRTFAHNPAGDLTLANNTTNYVYLDTTAVCVPASNTSGFNGNTIPLAVFVTSGGVITSTTEDRTTMSTAVGTGSIVGGTCTNQVVTVISTAGVPTCTTITSAYVNNSIALTGVDINTSNQVTATHLASALPVNQGGTATTSTLTGVVRGGNPLTASEMSGDCTTSGSNVLTCSGTKTIANGTSALGTGAITSATCATVVTTSATGTATTDNIQADFNADPTSTTGYTPSASGMLTIIKYPTTNNVNFKVCNNTASSITPGAVTLNWRVVR